MKILLAFALNFLLFLEAHAQSNILEEFKKIPFKANSYPEVKNKAIFDTNYGPRFEGWYTRITDQDGKHSVAFIVGSFLQQDTPFDPNGSMPGYMAVLVKDEENGEVKVYENFPSDTYLSVNGKSEMNQNPIKICYETSGCANTEFSWNSPSLGYINNEKFNITIPGEISIKGNFKNPIYWNNSHRAGPEGIVSNLPFFPLHWYVHSLGSQADYQYKIPSENIEVKSKGFAHIEKNWGTAFPEKWIWSEGISDNNSSHYALAGGELNLGLKINSFLVGFRTNKISYEFRPQQGAFFKTLINPCQGRFAIVIAKLGQKLVIESKANPKTFGKVSIPTVNGFIKDGAVESFAAKTSITAYSIDFAGNSTEVEHKNAALEFGGDYMCGGLKRP
jgi:hypothetical protein